MDLPEHFFDLILFDEGRHNVAVSWDALRARFPDARIVNSSATPTRADGQLMAGRVLYSYPVFRAIQEGHIKRLKAVVLNPRTLRYLRRDDGQARSGAPVRSMATRSGTPARISLRAIVRRQS